MNDKYDGHALLSVMFESFPRQDVKEVGSKDHSNKDVFKEFLSKNQEAWIKTCGHSHLQQYTNYGRRSKDLPEALYGYELYRLKRLRAFKAGLDPKAWFIAYQPFVKGLSAGAA